MAEYDQYESKMKKTISALSSELSTVRAGRANSGVLEQIRVDYYGAPTPISQIASVSTPDPRTLVISPWDASSLKAIEKAIQTSELGINPTNDGKVIRLAFPQLTEDRRKELTKQVAKYAEEAKVAIRNIRRDAVDELKAQKKRSEITEDDLKDSEKDLQKLTDSYVKEIDGVQAKKEAELLDIGV
ncbi:MAG: ribosome recycling factor [Oscillospiraceae bacterium]|jgi:ribosome recycling factor|nr:ribosome recycling factor [Oscillospiraceae bacterium]